MGGSPPHLPSPHNLDSMVGERVSTGRGRAFDGVTPLGALRKPVFSRGPHNLTLFPSPMSAAREVSAYVPQPNSNLPLLRDCCLASPRRHVHLDNSAVAQVPQGHLRAAWDGPEAAGGTNPARACACDVPTQKRGHSHGLYLRKVAEGRHPAAASFWIL